MSSLRQLDQPGLPNPATNLQPCASPIDQDHTVFPAADAQKSNALMSADEYRARAEALTGSSDAISSYNLILEAESMAATWRKLAELADLQDAMSAALAATRD